MSYEDEMVTEPNRFSPSKHPMICQEQQTLINKRDMELNYHEEASYREHEVDQNFSEQLSTPPKPNLQLDTDIIAEKQHQYMEEEKEIERQ